MKKPLFALPILLLIVLPAFTDPEQPIASPAEEAQPALFQARIGDAEVDFYLAGSWKATLAASLGFMVTPQGQFIGSPFPGFEDALINFNQVPDLTFSVWLLQRYFIEASVIGDFAEKDYDYFDQNYLLMGYKGQEDEFLKHLFIGTKDISIDPYPFLDIPKAGNSSLGAEALMGLKGSSHQLLLRYDNNEPASLTFIGQNLVEESEHTLDSYIRGRFFRLPDAGVEGLEVYLEDEQGTFSDTGTPPRRYRLATVDDAVLDSAQGLVSLKQAAKGAVLVYYTIGGAPVGTAGKGVDALVGESGGKIDLTAALIDFNWTVTHLGQAMSARQVTVGAKDFLRLWRPGEFSPFEILGAYLFADRPPEEVSRIRVQVVTKGNPDEKISSGVKFRLVPGADFFTAYRSTDLRGDFRNLYPFLDEAPLEAIFDPDNLLYGPSADPRPGYMRTELLVSFLTPVVEYRLGVDVVPGSVRVLRNGAAETRFEVDYDQGLLTFLTEISPGDRLVVSFRRKLSLLNNGDLLFAWGNTISLGSANTLQLAAGLRWNALPGNYTEEAYSRTGSVLVSVGLKGESGPLKYAVSAAAAFTNPDTTGIMRLAGMEGQGLAANLSEDLAYPASPPVNTSLDLDPPGVLSAADRGKLLYKDYRSYGLAGTSVLMPYDNRDWSPPPEQVFPYQDGSKPGPYNAAGSSSGRESGKSLVLDFELGDNQWAGAQMPVLAGQGLQDLSAMQSISLSYRAVDVQGSFTLYLQIGEIGEDLDGDGALELEASASSPGFPFYDSAAGVTLQVGSGPKNTGNGRLDSEDSDGNGFLDGEDTTAAGPNLLGPLSAAVSGDTGWLVLNHSFSASERARLRRVRSLRLLVVEDGAGATATGRVLIDRIALEGSAFVVDRGNTTFTPDAVTLRQVEEWEAANPPPQELEDAFPFVQQTFHPSGETQKVLEVNWSGGSSNQWQVRGYTQSQTEGIDYRTIVYYFRLPAVTGGTPLNFALLDTESPGRGLHWTLPVAGAVDAWSEIKVSLDDRQVYRNGAAVSGATVTVDPSYGSLAVFTVSLSATDSGTLYLDELHLTDPKSAIGAAAEADLELSLPGPLLRLGQHALIKDLKLREKAWFSSRGFSSLYGIPQDARQISSLTELSLGLSLADLSVDFLASSSDSAVSLSGGHRVILPNVPFPVLLIDAFSLREEATGRDLSRENVLKAALGNALALELRSVSSSLEERLTQTWIADLALIPAWLNLDNRLEISGSREGFAVPEVGYLANWMSGYSLLLPWTGGEEVERKSKVELAWGVETKPLAAQVSGMLGAQSYELDSTGRTQKSQLSLELSLPLSLTREQAVLFSLKPGYRRKLELVERLSGQGDFTQDFTAGFSHIGAQSYLWEGIPVAEIFSLSTEQDFLTQSLSAGEARYTPELFLQLSRSASSRIYDLFLPAYLELSVDKELRREGDLAGFLNHYLLKLQSRALNLFGSFGSHPLFPFYRTDELSHSLELSVGADRQALQTLGLLVDSFFSFEAEGGNTASLRNLFRFAQGETWTWSDGIELLFTWLRHPQGGVRLPLFRSDVGEGGYWSHQEGLDLTIAGADPEGEGGQSNVHPLNIVAKHETSLILPEFGYLKGELAAGFDIERAPGEGLYWRAGLRAAIEVKIEF